MNRKLLTKKTNHHYSLPKIFFTIFLIIGFTSLVLFTRFWKLGILPPGTHVDEPSFSIEAQSLVESGKDTWGNSWPLYFKAYGEYKAPGLIYSYVPLIHLFGHTSPLVSRLPSAIAGIIILLILYLSTLLLTPSVPKSVALTFIALISFSPWHFGTSRIYFETSGGLAFIALGIYAFLRNYRNRQEHNHLWLIIAGASLAIAGYWYASFRYVSMALIIIASFLQSPLWHKKFKTLAVVTFCFLFFGFGWIRYSFSGQGLNRLNQFQNSLTEGQTLVVNEKRAYCFLSFSENAKKSKVCYPFWNKPIVQASGFISTYIQYLSPEFLFFNNNNEYGVDKDYGAFLWPFILGYLAGIYLIAKSLKQLNTHNQTILIAAVTLLGFFPASIPQELSVHRSVVGLYGITLIILYGLSRLYQHFVSVRTPFKTICILVFAVITIFITIQSQLNYFLIFTKSNDVYWSSDVEAIYQTLNTLSPSYDRIIDTVYMGPTTAAFYNLIPASTLQTADRSAADPQGWSFVVKSGKYEYSRSGIDVLICNKLQNDPKNTKTLIVVSPKPEYFSIRKYGSTSFDKVHTLNEIYDLDEIINFDLKRNINWYKTCLN